MPKVDLNRLPEIDPDLYTSAQATAVARLIATPRGALGGPFTAMLYSPEFMNRAQSLGEFLRFGSGLPEIIRELAILATARFWQQEFEWAYHAPLAIKAGVKVSIIDAIAQQELSSEASSEEATVLAFCAALHQDHSITDSLYLQAVMHFGHSGVIELCGICGYYAMLAMVMNVAHTAPPPGTSVPFVPAGSR